MASGSTSRHIKAQNNSRPDYPRRASSKDASTANISADPEVMASLVDSLARIVPSPHHSFLLDDDDDALSDSLLIPRKPEQRLSLSSSQNYRRLHPDDIAIPPVVRISRSPSNLSSPMTAMVDLDKRASYTTEIPNHIKNYLRAENEEKNVKAKTSREKMRERTGFETPPLSPVTDSTSGLPIPSRHSSYNKASSPSRLRSEQGSKNETVLASPPPIHLQSPLSSPSSPTSKAKSQASAALKRQTSLPYNQSPVSTHRRSASDRLRRLSSPPAVSAVNSVLGDDKSSSGDSIDDAVEAYLCSPRLSQKLRFPLNGRTISFSEVGDPNGYAVFVCVGMGLTRYITAFYDDLALSLGLRLITPDRPGVGDSEAIPENERTVLSWPDDVLYICQSLKITKFSIMAHSAGAIYALATALRMSGQIRGKIHLLAPWIPPSQMTLIGNPQGENSPAAVPTSQRILRALPTPILKAANSSFMSATSSSLTSSLPKSPARKKKSNTDHKRSSQERGKAPAPIPPVNIDPTLEGIELTADMKSPTISSILQQEGRSSSDAIFSTNLQRAEEKERQQSYDERLTHAIWALATRNANPAVDLLVCLERSRPIGFRYVDITRAVVIHHGAKDNRVPVDNVKWLGTTMRRCDIRILPNEGHGLMASASVMGNVLTEIAAEWREWKRAMDDRGAAQQQAGTGWSM